jgi:hypothetical protein
MITSVKLQSNIFTAIYQVPMCNSHSHINIYMKNTIWTQSLGTSHTPWRIQNPSTGVIVDADDRVVAKCPKAGPLPYDQRAANLAAIAHAPELLGALRQAAYALTMYGVELKPDFYDLMNRASPGLDQLVPPTVREAGVGAIVQSKTRDVDDDAVVAEDDQRSLSLKRMRKGK